MSAKISTEQFIEKAKKIHGNKYDYSKVKYVNSKTKVCIICPEHGEFWQEANSHLKGRGCFKCGVKNSAIGHLSNKQQFIEKAKKIFGNSYDYSNVEYNKSSEKISVKCNKCGKAFLITPNSHLKGQGCPICARGKKGREKKETKKFIEEASIVHNNKYDYSNVTYIGSTEKVCIICPEHGEFWQEPSNHLRGQGCPICKSSKLENDVFLLLDKKGIKTIRKHKIKELGKQHLDFYLPDYNIAIECQGRQHIYPVFFGGSRFKNIDEQLFHIQYLDKIKKEICDKLNIKLLYYISEEIKADDLFKNDIYDKNNSFWDIENLMNSLK